MTGVDLVWSLLILGAVVTAVVAVGLRSWRAAERDWRNRWN